MEQLNRKRRQDEDIGYDNDVGQSRAPNNIYQDMRAAPQRLNKSIGFASLVRNKSAPPGLLREKIPKEPDKPTEVYHDNIKLECYQSELIPFKNLMFDASSMVKADVKDFSGFLTVRDYSQKLSSNNEKYKYR